MPPFVAVSLWLVEKVARVVFLANHNAIYAAGANRGKTHASKTGFECFGGKMKQILCSDWLPILPALLVVCRDGPIRNCFSFWPCNKSLIDQAWSVKIASYWPSSFVRFYWLTSISSRSIKRQKRNLANVRPFDLTIGRSHKLSTSVWSAKRS